MHEQPAATTNELHKFFETNEMNRLEFKQFNHLNSLYQLYIKEKVIFDILLLQEYQDILEEIKNNSYQMNQFQNMNNQQIYQKIEQNYWNIA